MKTLINKSLASFVLIALAASSFALPGFKVARAATPWDVSGAGDIVMNFEGTDYTHNVVLTQSGAGVIDGTGTSGTYAWDITSGSIEDSDLTFDANYTATLDAVVPQTVLHVEAVIAGDGSLSGTWSDNYNGGSRSGSLSAAAGFAVPLAGSLAAQDFGVMDFSGVKGYTAGWALTDADFTGAQSIVVKLYSGATLLQTDTAINPTTAFTGLTQISSPFDVFGTFDYAADGYWTNLRESEYGQNLIPDRVTATVVLANGKEVTAENTNLTGDPATIFPAVVTNAATAITSSDATLNGMNEASAGIGHSFWASLSPFSTESPVLPAGVYSTPDLGPIAPDTAFSALLSSVSGLPAITADTTYYFAAWVNVDGTWYPGEVLNFDTLAEDADPGMVKVTIVKYIDGEMATAESAGGDSFAMVSSWDAENIGAGSGSYSLASDNDTAYTAVTADMSSGADYSTSEVMNESVGESCDVDGVEYSIGGYTYGNSLEEAGGMELSDESPAFVDLTSDKYVIVWNDDCSTPEDAEGEIGGEVGGTGVLAVTSVETLDGSAVADNTYENGWKFRFNVTVPTDENGVAMKFANWDIDGVATDSIPAANNMRISSAQAVSETPITVTAADTYTIPDLDINEDLDLALDGLQIQVLVEVKIPAGTTNGSYTTSYGVRTQ